MCNPLLTMYMHDDVLFTPCLHATHHSDSEDEDFEADIDMDLDHESR